MSLPLILLKVVITAGSIDCLHSFFTDKFSKEINVTISSTLFVKKVFRKNHFCILDFPVIVSNY